MAKRIGHNTESGETWENKNSSFFEKSFKDFTNDRCEADGFKYLVSVVCGVFATGVTIAPGKLEGNVGA